MTLSCSPQGQSAMIKFSHLPFWNTPRDCTVHSGLWIESLRFIQNTHFCKEPDCIASSSLEKEFYWHRYMNIPSASTLEKGFGLFINMSADLPAKSNRFFSDSNFWAGRHMRWCLQNKIFAQKMFSVLKPRTQNLQTCQHVSHFKYYWFQ